jgi:hypothetical protein
MSAPPGGWRLAPGLKISRLLSGLWQIADKESGMAVRSVSPTAALWR